MKFDSPMLRWKLLFLYCCVSSSWLAYGDINTFRRSVCILCYSNSCGLCMAGWHLLVPSASIVRSSNLLWFIWSICNNLACLYVIVFKILCSNHRDTSVQCGISQVIFLVVYFTNVLICSFVRRAE